MKKNQIDEIEKLITKYAEIRIEFEEAKEKYKDYLAGNDNYIGIIGEYWAKRFLEQIQEEKISAIEKDDGERDLSSEWTDFQVANELISVKAITEENNSKESGYIKYPKNKQDDKVYSAIIIKLNQKLYPEQLLYVKNLDKSLKNRDEKFMRDYIKNWKNDKLCFKYYDSGFDTKFDKIYFYDKDLSKFKN